MTLQNGERALPEIFYFEERRTKESKVSKVPLTEANLSANLLMDACWSIL